MPKDATKNIDRYKIKGGQLNEFDFQRQQEEFAETSKTDENLIPGTPPEQRSDQPLPFFGRLTKKAGRAAKSALTSPARGTAKAKSTVRATAKKSAAKATTKKSAAKATTKKSAKATKATKASKAMKTRPRGATAKKLAARKAAKK